MTGRGVVALGDSITRGRGGAPALGVHPQSWAQWLAEVMELPFTNLSMDGAVTADVLRLQVPRLRGEYDLALLYTGVNDVRALVFDSVGFERDLGVIASALDAVAARVVLLTLPEDLGRPSCGPKPAAANAAVRRVAAGIGATVVELADFGGARFVLPDTVHPTSAGMLEIADRAAAALGVSPPPSTTVEIRPQGARYAAWWGRLWARDVLRRARERAALRR